MTSPSSTAFLRPDIGQSFEEFDLAASQQGFVAHRVLPHFETLLQSANFSKITIESLLRNQETLRAPGGGYNRNKYQFEQDNYATKEHGAEEPVDDRERQMYAYSFDIERISAMRARDVVLRSAEIRVANKMFSTSTWTGAALTTAVSNKWSVPGSATPVSDVHAAKAKVRASCGMLPNAVVMTWETFNNLQTNAEIIDRIKYHGGDDPKKITEEALAALFQVEEVIVAGAVQNTANENQNAAISDVWNTNRVLVCKLARTRDLREPCVGRTFHFALDGSAEGGTVEQYRDETVRSDIMRVRHDVDEKIIYAQAGHLLTNID